MRQLSHEALLILLTSGLCIMQFVCLTYGEELLNKSPECSKKHKDSVYVTRA